jgi:vacuolar-type H+-ATPase subunit I/STV1
MAPPEPVAAAKTDALTIGSTVLTASLAGLYGLAVLVIAVLGVINTVSSDSVTIPQPVSVDIPLVPSGTLELLEGSYRTADITVAGVTAGVRALLVSSMILDAVMHLAVVFGIIMLCVALVRGRPFMRAMVRTLIVISFALVVCGMLGSSLLGFANMEVAHALDRPEFPMVAELDFTSAIVGIALALVATAFKIGERLQRDTEGLI